MSNKNILKNTFAALAFTTFAATQTLAENSNNFIINDPSGIDYAAIGETNNPKKILVLLHGSGDNYKAIASLGENVAEHYPDLLILVPNGPKSFTEILQPAQKEMLLQQNPNLNLDNMRNWAGSVNLDGTETQDQIMQLLEESQYETADALNAIIQSHLDQHSLEENDVSLYGFSAGGSMAMYTALRDDHEYKRVLNHSGALYGPYENPPSTPPISIIMGDRETALLQGLPVMVESLQTEGVDVTSYILKNTGHEISLTLKEHFYDLIEELLETNTQQNPTLESSSVAPE